MEDEKMVCDRLKALRQTLKLKQVELANETGASTSYVSCIESGSRFPSYEFLLSLCEKLNVNVNWMLIGEGEMFRDYKPEPESHTQKLRKIYPGLPTDPAIDDLVETLQVPIMAHALLSVFLLKRKEYRSFIDEYFEEGEINEKITSQSS